MSADLEREAREESKSFAKRTFESGIAVDMGQIGASERGFYFGFKAAATLREKEIEELRAKLEAVPVAALQSINSFASEYAPEDGDWPTEDEFDQADRWLSTVTK